MDSPEQIPQQPDLLNPPPLPVVATAGEELHIQCADLRRLFNATFVGLIALSLAVNLVVGKQMRMVKQQITRFQPTFNRDDTDFRRNGDPQIRTFMKQLHQYAATHPEYQTNILYKYRVPLADYFSTGVIVGQPPPIPQNRGR